MIVDPSHATGKRWLVKPLALGGVAVGADGVMVEVHPTPEEALSDAEQQLDFDQFRDLMAVIVPVHEHLRGLHGDAVRSGGGHGQRWGRRVGEALMTADVATIRPAARLRGEVRLPGDKSISHRALILATLAAGESSIVGAGDGADVRSTAASCGPLARASTASRATAGRSTTSSRRQARPA